MLLISTNYRNVVFVTHRFDAAIKVVIFENSLPLPERRFYRIYSVGKDLKYHKYVCALAALHLPAAGRSSANSTLAGFRFDPNRHNRKISVAPMDMKIQTDFSARFWVVNRHGRIQNILATHEYEITDWFFNMVLCVFMVKDSLIVEIPATFQFRHILQLSN